MKRLIIGNIPSDFNPNDDEVFAPYCFLNNTKYNITNENFITNLELTPLKKKQIDKITSDFALKVINDIYSDFNKKNGLNYSYNFWKKILYSWLVSLIQHAYERELQVKKIVKEIKHPMQVTLLREKINWQTETTSDFFDVIYSLDYNEWLVSRFFEKLAPKNWKISYREKLIYNKKNVPKSHGLKNILKKLLSNIFKRSVKIYGLNLIDRLIIELYLRLKKPIKFLNYSNNSSSKLNQTILEFSYPLEKLMKITQPLFLTKLDKKIKKFDRKFKPGKVILGGSQYIRGDDDFKVKVGLAVENNELFIGAQHGGDDYGMSMHCEEIFNNEFDNFSFITWGWNKHSTYPSSKFIKLPSPFLIKFINKHQSKKDMIILVGTRAHLSNRFLSAKPSENQWIEYRDNKLKFFKKIISMNFNNIYYKPYPKTQGSLTDEGYFKKNIPQLSVIKNDFHQKIMNCKLLILDHPGTTLNIAMAANIPTILFWKENHFPLENNAQKILKEFKLFNLFFDDYEKLAFFIYENQNHINDWWNSFQIQKLRKKWCDNYALCKKKWRKDWIQFLNNL